MSTTISYKHASLKRRLFAALSDGVFAGVLGSNLVLIAEVNCPQQGLSVIPAFLMYCLIEIFGFPVAFAVAVLFWSSITKASETAVVSGIILLVSLLPLLISSIYHGVMESLPTKATLGKLAMGILVSDLNGNKISFMRAMFRYLAKGLSTLTCGLGYLMALGKTGQALHDKLTGCIVLSKE